MKSDIEIEDEFYELMKRSQLARAINGDIYKGPDERPDNSDKEDVEIIVIANQNGQIQSASISINVYAKDLDIDGQMRRNTPRLRQFAQLLKDQFEQPINVNGYRITLEKQKTYKVPEVHQGYVNVKLNYKYYNHNQ